MHFGDAAVGDEDVVELVGGIENRSECRHVGAVFDEQELQVGADDPPAVEVSTILLIKV